MKAAELRIKMLDCLSMISQSHKDGFRARIIGAAYRGESNIIFSAGNARWITIPNETQIKNLKEDGYKVEQFPPDAKSDEPRRVMVSW